MSAPALAAASDCTLYLAVRGTDNHVYLNIRAGGIWGDWTQLPGSTIDAAAATVAGSLLHFAVRGSDGLTIWHGRMDRTTLAWLGWNLISGSTPSKLALAAVSAKEVYLAARGTDSHIYGNRWDGSAWTGWTMIPTGSTPNGPSITAANSLLYVVVQGTDNKIYSSSRVLSTTTWSSWVSIPGSTISSPAMA